MTAESPSTKLDAPTLLEIQTKKTYSEWAIKSLTDTCKRQKRDRLIATGCVGLALICLAVGCVGTITWLIQP